MHRVVSSKNGALVRAGVELDSEVVTTLECGKSVAVVDKEELPNGTVRYRIGEGWVSAKVLRKRKIAVLHGTAANGAIAKIQLAPLLRRLDDYDVVLLDGPRTCREDGPHVATMRKFFGKNQILREFAVATVDERGWRTYEDVEGALRIVDSMIDADADVLVGFSQGANFAAMMAARRIQQLKCVLLFCGARPGWARQLPSTGHNMTPAFLVAATNDTVVEDGPYEMAKLFQHALMRTHDEGHKPLPSKQPALDNLLHEIVTFLDDSFS